MSDTTNKNINEYIKQIDRLLPYSSEIKEEKLSELRTDIKTALEGSDNDDINVVFGDYREVAKNFSKGQDWGTESAGWGIRLAAWIIDVTIFLGAVLLLFLGGLFIILTAFFTPEERNQIIGDLFSGKVINLGDVKLIEGILPVELWLLFISGFTLISIIVAFAITYFFVQEGLYSTTIGKKLFKLIAVDKSGIKLTWQQAILRNLTKIAGQFFPFDILIGILMEKQEPEKLLRQRAMDVLAGTTVVKQTKN
ncbi:MAG: RDD family protein [Candidatus Hodarchaeales archaeon]